MRIGSAYAQRWIDRTPGALALFRAAVSHTEFRLIVPKTHISSLRLLAEREKAWKRKNKRKEEAAKVVWLATNDFSAGRRLAEKGFVEANPSAGQNGAPTYFLTPIGWMVLDLLDLAGL